MMVGMSWSDPDEALARLRSGEASKFLFFWGHRPEKDGRVGKGCFSQWWPSPFVVEGVRYATAEHWMMAGKARLFQDEAVHAEILAARSPGEAKKLGRRVRGFDEQVWVRHRYDLVADGSLAKFSQHPELAEVLRRTGRRTLAEAGPLDRIWGIGLSGDDEAAADPNRWRGLNLLGFALTEVREHL